MAMWILAEICKEKSLHVEKVVAVNYWKTNIYEPRDHNGPLRGRIVIVLSIGLQQTEDQCIYDTKRFWDFARFRDNEYVKRRSPMVFKGWTPFLVP